MNRLGDFVSSKKNLLVLMLFIGALQICGYYLAGALVRSDGGMAIPQTDTLLYCQAARRICEGHPFSFSSGTAVSTGTTSILYPFFLAIPYILGCTGDALIRAGFFLNALFYLVFLLGWGLAVQAKLKAPLARLAAAVTIAGFGQTAYSAFAQSDIGLWLAVSGLFAGGLATGNRRLYGTLLLLGPWIRPEGMVVAMAFFLIVGVYWTTSRRNLPCGPRPDFKFEMPLALLGLTSMVGVFAFNYALTGQCQFSSVALKGHFKTLPFAQAVFATSVDLLKILKALVLGLPASSPRDLYFVPVLGALLAWLAVFARNWRAVDWREYVWLLAVGGGILTVAQSGWQNTNIDRYLGWTLPTLLFFMAAGAGCLAEGRIPQLKGILPALMIMLFTAGMAPVHMCMLNLTSRETDLLRAFAVNCERIMTQNSAVGTWGDCGIAYEMSPRRVAHLGGIYSPEFLVKEMPCSVYAILKNEPDKRYWYYFYNPTTDEKDIDAKACEHLSTPVLTGPFGYELRKAKWEAFDEAARPPSPPAKGVSLKASVDVGYLRDEEKTDFETSLQYDQPTPQPFLVYGQRNGKPLVDVARLILGAAEMTVPLEPGKDVHVVLRTYPSHETPVQGGFGSRHVNYAFSNPLAFCIEVDGKHCAHASVPYATNGISDVSFKIPGKYIQSTHPRICFEGEHIACGYWFYQ